MLCAGLDTRRLDARNGFESDFSRQEGVATPSVDNYY
jgi:hypothetical protein